MSPSGKQLFHGACRCFSLTDYQNGCAREGLDSLNESDRITPIHVAINQKQVGTIFVKVLSPSGHRLKRMELQERKREECSYTVIATLEVDS